MNWLILAGLNILGSLILPFAINYFSPLQPFQEWVIGGIFFLSLSCIETLQIVKSTAELQIQEHRTWIDQDEFDSLLSSIRNDYRNMRLHTGAGGVEFVRQLLRHRVEKLRDEIHVTSESQEVYADNNHAVDTSRVTDIFRSHKASTFSEVFLIDDGQEMFGIYGGAYFKQIHELTVSGDITEVKALLVVKSSDAAALDKAEKLLSFYKSTPKYDVRVLSTEDFGTIRMDTGLEAFEDFGIYGDTLLFQTMAYEPTNLGKFSYSGVKIRRFKAFFDACWNLPERLKLKPHSPALGVDEAIKL